MEPDTRTVYFFSQIEKLMKNAKRVVIILQDNPDPDALGSASAFLYLIKQRWQLPVKVMHGGMVGRAENRALLKYLNMQLLPYHDQIVGKDHVVTVMLDTQPGFNNNCWKDGDNFVPHIIIDHHPVHQWSLRAVCADLRENYGATSTILTEYLVVANLIPPTTVATGLLYGIRSDTQELGRDAIDADREAFFYLYPMVNFQALSQILHAPVPSSYFVTFAYALLHSRIYENCLIANLGEIYTPDMVPELADWLLRHDQIQWVLTFGNDEKKIYFSLRTTDHQSHAGKIMYSLMDGIGQGGGHNLYAGGQIILSEGTDKCPLIKKFSKKVVTRLLNLLGIRAKKSRLLIPKPTLWT